MTGTAALLAFVLLLVSGGGALWITQRRAAQARALRFSGRRPLTAEELWREFYEQRGVPLEMVEEILQVIAEAAGVPAGLIRPADRFDSELAPEKGWEFDDGLAEIIWWVKDRAKRSGRRVGDISNVRTVDDLVNFVFALSAPPT